MITDSYLQHMKKQLSLGENFKGKGKTLKLLKTIWGYLDMLGIGENFFKTQCKS